MPLKVIKDEDLKIYYSISEVARHFGVNTSLIRFWEKEFPQLKPKKNTRGDRVYTKKDVQLLEVIYRLVKIEGYTLDGARKHLSARRAHLSFEEPASGPQEATPTSAHESSETPVAGLAPDDRAVLRDKLMDAYAGIMKIEQKLRDFAQRHDANNGSRTLFELEDHK